MVRGFNRNNSKNIFLKVDLHKAYDKINTVFIHHILISIGLPIIFANLIYECIATPSFSVLIDGSPCGFIESTRDLRQGDPLSLYLFAIALEFLSINLEMEFLKGNITPIYNIEPIITHLLCADDILILAKATKENAECIMQIFQSLKTFTGLDLNQNKSTLFF